MQLTYFFDVCSMWCALSDAVLAEIQKRYGDRVPITRKIALINDGAPLAAGLEQEQWYYQRCEVTTGRRFNHRWIEKRGQLTWLPNALIYVRKAWPRAQSPRDAEDCRLDEGRTYTPSGRCLTNRGFRHRSQPDRAGERFRRSGNKQHHFGL